MVFRGKRLQLHSRHYVLTAFGMQGPGVCVRSREGPFLPSRRGLARSPVLPLPTAADEIGALSCSQVGVITLRVRVAMGKHVYPEFHKALLLQSAYVSAPRRIKFQETARSYLYRTGEHVFKVRKTSAVYSSLAIKERFAQHASLLGNRWAGDAVQDAIPIVHTPDGFTMGGTGEPVDYALQMTQLPDSQWLHRLLEQGKVTSTLIGRLARFLAEHHSACALDEAAATAAGHPHQVEGILEELTYQARKYVGQTVSQPVLDMIARPLGKFLEETRRLMTRRLKRGRIVDGHGALIPEHLVVRGSDVLAFAPLEAQSKYRMLDAANDVAALANGLAKPGGPEHAELADLLIRRYASAAKDRDLPRVVPVYRVLQSMRLGLVRSEQCAELPVDDSARATLGAEATAHYNLALQAAKEMAKVS